MTHGVCGEFRRYGRLITSEKLLEGLWGGGDDQSHVIGSLGGFNLVWVAWLPLIDGLSLYSILVDGYGDGDAAVLHVIRIPSSSHLITSHLIGSSAHHDGYRRRRTGI